MSEQAALDRRYMISVYEPNGSGGRLVFSFGPKGLMQVRGFDGSPMRVPRFVVSVRNDADRLAFDWSGTQDDPVLIVRKWRQRLPLE